VTVNDLLTVLSEFDVALSVIFGCALAVFLIDSVIHWFVRVFLQGDGGA